MHDDVDGAGVCCRRALGESSPAIEIMSRAGRAPAGRGVGVVSGRRGGVNGCSIHRSSYALRHDDAVGPQAER